MQKTILHLIMIVTGMLACRATVFAQKYRFSTSDIKEATPGSNMYNVFEDSKGYLWFISYRTVTRFDGTLHKVFDAADGFYETGAYRIIEDAEGVIWLLTVNHKLYYFKNNVFREIQQKVLINWLYMDEQGNKWAYGRATGVTYKLSNSGHLTPLYSYPNSGVSYTACVLNDSAHLLYLTSGIFFWTPGKLRRITNSFLYDHHIASRFFKIRDQIVVTTNNGIYEWKNNRLNQLALLDDSTEVYDMYLDKRQDYVWMATSKGLFRYHHDIRPGNVPQWYLKDKSIFSITKTRDDNIWLTTGNSGIYVFNSGTLHITAETGLGDENILFTRKESGMIYFFPRYSPYYRFSNNRLEAITYPKEEGKRELIKSPNRVSRLSDTSLIVFSNRAMIISRGRHWIRKYPAEVTSVSTLSENCQVVSRKDLTIERDGKVLLNTPKMPNLYALLQKKNIKMDGLMYPSYLDKDTLYTIGGGGVLKCYWIGNKAVVYVIKVQGLVSCITKWKHKTIIATRTNGVYAYSADTLVNYNDQNGMVSNYCSAIVVKDNCAWACCSKGLTRINLVTGKIRNYTAKDYLLDNEVNDVEFMNDTVYVATVKGVSYFREDIAMKEKPPAAYIEKVVINNDPVALSNQYRLPYAENNISLALSSPGYRSADFNRFRVIIDHDGDVDTTFYKSGLIQLLALMPGEYLLKADVMNLDGVWADVPVELSITIDPPFWKKLWFVGLVTLVVLNIIGYIVWLSVKRQKDVQEYNRKIVESELRSLRLYMNPHFLFNSLSSLQSFVLTRKNEEANSFITKFSKLIRSVMTYSIRGELKLSEEISLLHSYLELESIRFNKEFTFEVSADPSIYTEEVIVPSLIIQPFVENAIKHGVTGTGRTCYIKVHFFMNNEELYCRVQDNGKGRVEKPVRDKDYISSGVSFTVERIRLLVNRKAEEIISFKDTNQDENMRGTTVDVLVPVLNKAD